MSTVEEVEVELLECPSCLTWWPQDHADAQGMGVPAWTTHMLQDHPDHPLSRLLDGLLLDGILGA